MKNIIKSFLVIAAVAALAGGATWSAWHDKGSILGVQASSDTMDLKIDNNLDGGAQNWVDEFTAPSIPDLQKLKPGSALGDQIIDIKNVGDVAGKATLKFVLTSSKENGLKQPENLVTDSNYYNADNNDANWNGELAQNMRVQIEYSASNDNNWTNLGSDTLAGLHDRVLELGNVLGNKDADGATTITDGTVASVRLSWSIPWTATNEIMSDTVGVNLVFGLDQIP